MERRPRLYLSFFPFDCTKRRIFPIGRPFFTRNPDSYIYLFFVVVFSPFPFLPSFFVSRRAPPLISGFPSLDRLPDGKRRATPPERKTPYLMPKDPWAQNPDQVFTRPFSSLTRHSIVFFFPEFKSSVMRRIASPLRRASSQVTAHCYFFQTRPPPPVLVTLDGRTDFLFFLHVPRPPSTIENQALLVSPPGDARLSIRPWSPLLFPKALVDSRSRRGCVFLPRRIPDILDAHALFSVLFSILRAAEFRRAPPRR